MAFDTVPFCMDATTMDAEQLRRALGTLIGAAGGIVTPGDLTVSQQGSPNMSVQIGTGQVWVPGTSTASQGPYYSRNGAATTVVISAASASNPRVDTIIAQAIDKAYAGTLTQVQPAVVVGTPTPGIVTPPTTAAAALAAGAGAVPASSYVLAYVLVPTSTTSIVTANIANVATSCFTEVWTGLSYSNSYVDTAGGEEPGRWTLDKQGFVHVSGNVKKTTAWAYNQTIATLPAGARPGFQAYLWTRLNDATGGAISALVGVSTAGAIQVISTTPTVTPGNLTSLILNNLTFPQVG